MLTLTNELIECIWPRPPVLFEDDDECGHRLPQTTRNMMMKHIQMIIEIEGRDRERHIKKMTCHTNGCWPLTHCDINVCPLPSSLETFKLNGIKSFYFSHSKCQSTRFYLQCKTLNKNCCCHNVSKRIETFEHRPHQCELNEKAFFEG